MFATPTFAGHQVKSPPYNRTTRYLQKIFKLFSQGTPTAPAQSIHTVSSGYFYLSSDIFKWHGSAAHRGEGWRCVSDYRLLFMEISSSKTANKISRDNFCSWRSPEGSTGTSWPPSATWTTEKEKGSFWPTTKPRTFITSQWDRSSCFSLWLLKVSPFVIPPQTTYGSKSVSVWHRRQLLQLSGRSAGYASALTWGASVCLALMGNNHITAEPINLFSSVNVTSLTWKLWGFSIMEH